MTNSQLIQSERGQLIDMIVNKAFNDPTSDEGMVLNRTIVTPFLMLKAGMTVAEVVAASDGAGLIGCTKAEVREAVLRYYADPARNVFLNAAASISAEMKAAQ